MLTAPLRGRIYLRGKEYDWFHMPKPLPSTFLGEKRKGPRLLYFIKVGGNLASEPLARPAFNDARAAAFDVHHNIHHDCIDSIL